VSLNVKVNSQYSLREDEEIRDRLELVSRNQYGQFRSFQAQDLGLQTTALLKALIIIYYR